jgi:hypothetical protein
MQQVLGSRVNANQVFHWRTLYREGLLDLKPASEQLTAVHMAEVASDESRSAGPFFGTIHV